MRNSELSQARRSESAIEDRKVLKRINLLIKDVERNSNEGIGKPEALRHQFSDDWGPQVFSHGSFTRLSLN